MTAIYSNGGNRWNILGFNFTKRDALSSVYKISMDQLWNKTPWKGKIVNFFAIHTSKVQVQFISHYLAKILH